MRDDDVAKMIQLLQGPGWQGEGDKVMDKVIQSMVPRELSDRRSIHVLGTQSQPASQCESLPEFAARAGFTQESWEEASELMLLTLLTLTLTLTLLMLTLTLSLFVDVALRAARS